MILPQWQLNHYGELDGGVRFWVFHDLVGRGQRKERIQPGKTRETQWTLPGRVFESEAEYIEAIQEPAK